eukprot:m.11163 g.11163  ORF g.11163 m.11163 type:complete len:343 (+) comp2824_c0_seq1:59-1087(+)
MSANTAGPAADVNGNSALTSKDYYFDSYAHYGIHEEMLKDEVRTLTYRAAILGNRDMFKDKIVLDVGCGTGILSMFAARAGAKHVYAVDFSSILEQARTIVADNGMADKITLIRGKCEEVTLPVDHVDIIISEWMGYALLYESMLASVLFARDKWLVPGGLMLPSRTTMVLCAIEDHKYKEEKINWWENVYGFDMSCIKKLATLEPLVDIVPPDQIVTSYCQIKDIDTTTCTVEDLSFESPFELVTERDDFIHAFVLHFDTYFEKLRSPTEFSTGPLAMRTHWKQTVFYLPEVLEVQAGESINGTISCVPNKTNPRDMDFVISYTFHGKAMQSACSAEYRMR